MKTLLETVKLAAATVLAQALYLVLNQMGDTERADELATACHGAWSRCRRLWGWK